jgi:membrane protease YdiL (CAAX protease family)
MKKSISSLLWGALILAISLLSQIVVVSIYSFLNIFATSFKSAAAGGDPNLIAQEASKSIETAIQAEMYWLIPLAGIVSIFFLWVYTKARKQSFREELKFNKFSLKGIIATFFVGVALTSVVGIFLQLTGLPEMFNESQELVDSLVGGGNVLLTLIGVGILVPIIEELTFRGFLLSTLSRGFKVYIAVVIQALCFAAFHGNILQASYTFFVGLVAGLLVVWFKSVKPAIMLHVGFNSVNVLAAHFIQKNEVLTSTILGIFILIGLSISVYGLVKLKPWKQTKLVTE